MLIIKEKWMISLDRDMAYGNEKITIKTNSLKNTDFLNKIWQQNTPSELVCKQTPLGLTIVLDYWLLLDLKVL